MKKERKEKYLEPEIEPKYFPSREHALPIYLNLIRVSICRDSAHKGGDSGSIPDVGYIWLRWNLVIQLCIENSEIDPVEEKQFLIRACH